MTTATRIVVPNRGAIAQVGAPLTIGFDPSDADLFAPDGRTLTSPKPVTPRR